MRFAGNATEREAVRERIPPGAPFACADAKRDGAFGRQPPCCQARERSRTARRVERLEPRGECFADFPIVALISLPREQWLTVFDCVADCEHVKYEIEMVPLEREGRWQDEMRMARGFVDVEVDRQHELELRQRCRQLLAVGRREHRISRRGDKTTDLAFARSQDFFGQRRDGVFAAEFRQSTNAGPALGERPGCAEADTAATRIQRGLGEEGAPFAIEVARDDVERLDQPL